MKESARIDLDRIVARPRLEWRNWKTHGTQNHPYKLSIIAKYLFFIGISKPLT
jgi:hypothetical protein